jgi:hypothetical protein
MLLKLFFLFPNCLDVTYPGAKQLKDEALKFVLELEAEGGTNIHDSMIEGLKQIEDVHKAGVLPSNARQVQHLEQAWATSGPRATYGPPSTLMWPTNIF